MYKARNFIATIVPNRNFFYLIKKILVCFLFSRDKCLASIKPDGTLVNIINQLNQLTTMSMDSDWKGVPMCQIIGSQSPWGAPEFPLVQPAFNHFVLYHIPSSGNQLDRLPKPQIGKEKWDQEHVRMPFSKHSLYPVPNDSGETELKKRWEMIQAALNKPIKNSKELANAILSYNTQFKNRWKFTALHELFETCLDEEETQYFFDVTLPEIVRLALALPKLIQSPIPLLKQHKNLSVSLSQQQISSLLANAFFCTFPRRNTTKQDSEYSSYPSINFNVLYDCSPSEHVLEKLKCICFYFRRVCTKVPAGVVTFSRRSVPPRALPAWPESARPLSRLLVHADASRTIEDAHGLVQVDFANKYLGGGVLNYGSVQEEIRFMICPELMASMLFTEVLRPNEALMIIGCEQYSKYSGYGHSFQWAGEHVDHTPRDSSQRRRCAVLAIDATPFRSARQERSPAAVTRELNKAWVGFSFYSPEGPGPQHPGVATGNWGCGAFGGTAHLKALLQMMALAQAGRPMAYYTFGDAQLRDDIVHMHNVLVKHGVTVGQLYKLIVQYCESDVLKSGVYSFLEKALDGRDTSTTQTSSCELLESMEYDGETEKYAIARKAESTLDKSPDMFSQDDEDYRPLAPAKLRKNTNSENSSQNNSKISDDGIQISDTDCNMSDTETSATRSTSNTISKMLDTTAKMSDTKPKILATDLNTSSSSSLTAVNSKRSSQTLRLFDEMEKLDEDSGKLNLKSPQKPLFVHKNKKMDVEGKLSEVSPDVKKKLTRKITDYFSKKPV